MQQCHRVFHFINILRVFNFNLWKILYWFNLCFYFLQIDGSTLKTLCMQHGPLQMFHLFLNRGVALVRYNSHEEAAKAQSALNNCVLSNTTMLAELPSDAEVQQYLQSAQGAGASTNSWPAPSSASSFYGGGASVAGTASWNAAPNNTSQLWSFSGSSLWSQPSNDHDASTNPINYLPNDLLGGEPIWGHWKSWSLCHVIWTLLSPLRWPMLTSSSMCNRTCVRVWYFFSGRRNSFPQTLFFGHRWSSQSRK